MGDRDRLRPVSDVPQRVLQLFLAGATYPQIAAAVDVDAEKVPDLVAEAFTASDSTARRSTLLENARAIHLERTEALFKAHWASALRGDHRSAEIVARILERQARSFGVEAQATEGDSVDEISARRAARRAGTTSGSSRAKRQG
jgi:hypothetical protein